MNISPLIVLLIATTVSCDKKILLERSSQEQNGQDYTATWADFLSVGTKGKTKHGWQFNYDSNPKNGFLVCDTEIEGAENWLRTPYIALDDAKIVKIQIWYNQKQCSNVEAKSSEKCDNKVSVSYLHRSNASPDDKSAYTSLDSYIGDFIFTESNLDETSQEDEAYLYEAEIDLEKSASSAPRTISDGGIYLAFTDHGSCTVIHSIKVFYYFCPNTVKNFTQYPRTTSSSGSTMVFGSCQNGASSEPDRQPKALCNNAGVWDHLKASQDKCLCDAGYESDSDDNTYCQRCPNRKYKAGRSAQQCIDCPLNSSPDKITGSTKCLCNPGFFPPPKDFHDQACQRPPPPPVSPSAVVENTAVHISWNPPSMDMWYSGRNIWYRVKCEGCPYTVSIPPELHKPEVKLFGLDEHTDYVVRIFSENTLTIHNPGSAQYAVLEFQTENKAQIRDFEAEKARGNTIHLSWVSEPVSMREQGFRIISQYNSEHQSEQIIQETSFTMPHMAPGAWTFQVCSNKQQDVCSNILAFQVDGNPAALPIELSPKHLVITASMIMAIILLMLVILILAVYCYRKSTPLENASMWHKSHRSMHLLDVSPNYYSSQTESSYGLKSPLGQSFVDPKCCEDPEKMLYEFTREIPIDQLEMMDPQKLLPGLDGPSLEQFPVGNFGKAVLHTLDEQRIEVITKRCDLMNVSNSSDFRAFALEAAIASQFNDPNVLMVYGLAYGPSEAFMCYEVAHKGNLLSFVRESCDQLTPIQIVHLLRGVSCGMQYLSDLGYTHKVLIAENIAVNSSGICKIAGFDMRTALELEEFSGAPAKICKYLVPWSAPEVINYKKYSGASDVYSFATVIWEVFSRGSSPHLVYPKSSSSNLADSSFHASMLLSIPEACPEAISELMSSCWNPDKAGRPDFRQIRETLDNIVRHPMFMNQPFSNTLMYQGQQQYPTMGSMVQRTQTQAAPVEQMLKSLKLDKHYLTVFIGNNILDISDLLEVTEDVLVAIGITNNKHKKKIMTHIDGLKKQHQSKYLVTSNSFKNSPVNLLV